ncbi:MAG: PmoA family protein [Phycisphaerae bacterium]|nr:PmoA family protein [Phycisphaerae bacterium]
MTALSLDLEGIDYVQDGQEIVLYRLDGDKKISLPCQLDNGHTAKLWFIPDRIIQPNEKLILEVSTKKEVVSQNQAIALTDKTTITLKHNDKNILSYYYGLHDVPKGINPLYKKSGFVHPLWSPGGKVLTRIQPTDHYHHYGIWGPWTKTIIDGRHVDFWNLAEGQGTVSFAGILSTVSGPVYCGLKVKQDHIDFKYPGESKKTVMTEVLDIRASACQIEDKTVWIIDYTSTLHNNLASPIELENYRYGGGIGFRATEQWKKDNCTVLTSEGKNREQADGTSARWCDVNGQTGKDEYSGILFLSHTANRQHPEPMRVWPLNSAGGGEMFFEFCPIRHKSWIIEPQKEYVLRYRMIVYDGKIKTENAEALWGAFTRPPTITKINNVEDK